eukprot:190960-Pelagomonas_calceolata.AAC.1
MTCSLLTVSNTAAHTGQRNTGIPVKACTSHNLCAVHLHVAHLHVAHLHVAHCRHKALLAHTLCDPVDTAGSQQLNCTHMSAQHSVTLGHAVCKVQQLSSTHTYTRTVDQQEHSYCCCTHFATIACCLPACSTLSSCTFACLQHCLRALHHLYM